MTIHYTVVLTPESDGSAINVMVPALPGVLTWGATVEEALASAREAIELHLEGFAERGKPFPRDRKPRVRGQESSSTAPARSFALPERAATATVAVSAPSRSELSA
jgi:antitoxin HicB